MKAKALIGYLALRDHHQQSRERLAGLFWSDRSEEQARASLRQTIRRLRVIFADNEIAPLTISRHEIGLSDDLVNIDLNRFVRQLEKGEIPQELLGTENPTSKILYGFEDLDGLFNSWLVVARQIWGEKITKLLFTIMREETSRSSDAARALLNLDNTNEEAHRHLIKHYADQGNTARSLNQYKTLWDMLGDDYDMEPAEETQQLIAAIKSGAYAPVSKSAHDVSSNKTVLAAKPVNLPIISVENFDLHGLEKKAALSVRGLRYELIASLVKFRQWIIVEGSSRDSPPLLMNKPETLRHLGYSLSGACFADGNNIRLILTLNNQASTHYIWSGIFTISMLKWLDLQRQITRQISVALNIHLSQQQLDQLIGQPNLPMETYTKWLRGQALSFIWRAEARDSAADLFLSIIEEHPDFTPAQSSYVQLENTRHIAFPGVFRDQSRERKAMEIAKSAVSQDPLDSRSQLCLAWSLIMNGFRDQALNHFWLAYDLNENDPWTMISVAGGLSVAGEIQDALSLVGKSLNVNPAPSSSHWAYQATVRFLAEDYEGCIAASKQAKDAVFYMTAWEAAAHEILGKRPEAEARAEHFFANVKSNWHGRPNPSREEMARWLGDCIPIFNSLANKRLRKSLQRTGIPIPD